MVTKVKTRLAKTKKNKSENSPQESHEIEESSGHTSKIQPNNDNKELKIQNKN